MKSKITAVALGLMAAVGLAAPAAAADTPVQLKLSHWVPPAHPLHPSLQEWLASLTKASGGTITGTIFPSEQLGKAFDHYDMARDGIADFAYVGPGYTPGRFPVVAIAQLPFMMSNAKGGSAALDTWYRKYAAREMKDVYYCLGFAHDPGAVHGRKKISVPGDIKGLKVRPAQATIAEFVTLLGGSNVKASAPEAREMLERGVADAITFPWGSILLFGIDKAVKYHLDSPLYVANFVWVMNKDKYQSLSPMQKKAVDSHCTTEWAVKLASPWADFEDAGRDKIRAMPDHEVYKISSEQLGLWKKAAEPLQKSWADSARKAGIDPDAAYKDLKALLAKHNAGY